MNEYEVNINHIADIIANFRRNELSIVLDANHVDKWASQFSKANRCIVVSETYHVLKQWYFDVNRMKVFLDKIDAYLKKTYDDCLDDFTFWDGQSETKSQHRLLNIYPRSNIYKDTQLRKHIVYIDDGIYTGNRIRKDVEEIINKSEHVETIDIFTWVGYCNAVEFSKGTLTNLAKKKNISLTIDCQYTLYNDKETRYDGGTESYTSTLDIIWPSPELERFENVSKYISYLKNKNIQLHYKFRTHSLYTSNVFSNQYNKSVLEKEFLLAGLSIIAEDSYERGIYPLGFDSSPSLGFGSFCATDFNISNTCPIVLWWDVNSSWYPLLPRRIN